MSRGPGLVEARIAELLAANRDRALTINDLADNAYGLNGRPATRAQRLSATRAAHRVLRRVQEAHDRAGKLTDKAHADTKAALGRERRPYDVVRRIADTEYDERFDSHPGYVEARKLFAFAERVGLWMRIVRVEGQPGRLRGEFEFWLMTRIKGRLYLHPPTVPLEVWAVMIDRNGVHWFDAKVMKVTARNVMVAYAGESARLDRERLWHGWAFWRAVRFVSSRTGRIAAELDRLWHERHGSAAGGVPPSMRMPLDEARQLLGLPLNYTREDVIAAFRRAVKKAHPDLGGTAEMFHKLVEARDRLLAALGTSAPPPKPPGYAPSGVTLVYRSGGGSCRPSLGMIRQLPGR
jgi:hypothetical protein